MDVNIVLKRIWDKTRFAVHSLEAQSSKRLFSGAAVLKANDATQWQK